MKKLKNILLEINSNEKFLAYLTPRYSSIKSHNDFILISSDVYPVFDDIKTSTPGFIPST